MKKFEFGNLRSPLVVLLLVIAALFSNCRKETFDALQQPAPTVFSPLTLGEAKSWYGTFQSLHQYDGTSSQYFNAVPDWDYAFIDSAKNGNPIVVVPIRDSSIRAASQGRSDLKMILYRTEQDTIGASLILYAADSSYHATDASEFSLDDFSGIIAFYDLNQDFQFGVKLQDGAGVARLDTMIVEVESGEVEDRTDWYTIECETVHVATVSTPCPAQVFEDCWITHSYWETRCWTFGGGGGGGGGSGSGGSGGSSGGSGGGSGGSGSGSGSGGSGGSAAGGGSDTTFYNPNQPSLSDILNGWTPTNLLQQYEAYNIPLPLGYGHLRDELIYLDLLYNLSQEQMEYLIEVQNIELIQYLYDFSKGPQNGEEAAQVVPVLDFVMAHGLSAEQYI